MFGKKKETDEFVIPEEFDMVEKENQPEEKIKSDNLIPEMKVDNNISDEEYLDSLLDNVMGNHENDSPSEVEDEIIEDKTTEDGIPEEEVIEDEIVKEEIIEEEHVEIEKIAEDILDGLEIIEDEEEEYEEYEEADSNAIENIEEYIEQSEEEQNELMIDTPDESEIESENIEDDLKIEFDNDDILKGLDEIVSGIDTHEEILEKIFDEPEEIEDLSEEKTRNKEEDFVLREEETLSEKSPKEKKPGFFKKLFGKFSHKEEPETEIEEGDIDFHSENKRLLNELDEEDENEKGEAKKGENKKDKKEKKTKEAKAPKIKKPVDPEMEEKVKMSPKVGFLLFSIIVVIIIGVLAGGSVLSYRQRIADATDYFVTKNYSAAYKMVESSNLKKTDQEFYQQLRLIMYVHRSYESYLNFKEIGDEAKALNALVKGVGNYELYKEQGKDYNVLEEMQYSLGLIKDALKNDYNVTETQARELFIIEDRNMYSTKIYEIIDEME